MFSSWYRVFPIRYVFGDTELVTEAKRLVPTAGLVVTILFSGPAYA
jgi:hypothetical protein